MHTYRIYLSPPYMGEKEKKYLDDAYASNWIVPMGPYVDKFERAFEAYLGEGVHCAALASGTAGIHLGLRLAGVEQGDEVICSDLTFIASASPIIYQHAKPIFVDADPATWNMDLNVLEDLLRRKSRAGKAPKAIVAVHLYGIPLDMPELLRLCDHYGVKVIEDAAESLGSTIRGRATGTYGSIGIFSFNGNKIMTTSGGAMVCSADKNMISKVKYLATQARMPEPHYEHEDVGYNYRLSNLLAAVGLGQLETIEDRVKARRATYAFYREKLGGLPGIKFMPDFAYCRANNWLSCLTIDKKAFGVDREGVRLRLASKGIEARPVWKPMHLQPVFKACEYVGGSVGADIFADGLCLPSGTGMTMADKEEVVAEILASRS